MSAPQVLPAKPNALADIFTVKKAIIGVIHLKALPGAPRYGGAPLAEVYDAAKADALALATGGIDGICVENASDLPFARPDDVGPETVAALTAACDAVRSVVDLPLGITCVANAVVPALAVAKATGARWVRANQWVNAYVANEGLMNGPAPAALRYRAAIGAQDVRIFADVHVKFGSHAITADRSIADQATDAEWFDADVLVATGTRTGAATHPSEVADIRDGTNLPVVVGSGFDPDQVEDLLPVVDGAIVGQWLKYDGLWWNPVDPTRVKELMDAVRLHRNDLEHQREPGQ